MRDDVSPGRYADSADAGWAGTVMGRDDHAAADRGTSSVRWMGITTGITYASCAECFAADTRCYGSAPGATHFEITFNECDAFSELASRGRDDYPHAGADPVAKSHIRATTDARRRLLRHGQRRRQPLRMGSLYAHAIAAYARLRHADTWRGLHLARIALGRGN